MKYIRIMSAVMLVVALFAAGCGKSRELLKIESDVSAEIGALQKDLELSLSGLAELQTKLDKSLQTHNALKKKFAKAMKNRSANDIAAARQGLDAAKNHAETAISAMSTYDNAMEHDKAMQILNANKEAVGAKDKVLEAINDANAAVANHEKIAKQLTKKRK